MFSMSSIPRPTKTYHTEPYERILSNHKFNGAGKTVLITGGTGGIGLAISKAFLTTGARVAVTTRSPPEEYQNTNSITQGLLVFQASLNEKQQMQSIFCSLGTVDVLVLNAAVAHRRAPCSEITSEEFKEAFDINVIASFNITQMYLAMPQPAQKTIINISSAVGTIMGAHRVGYGASKGAEAMVMQSFAAQYKASTIISVHPGSIYTTGTSQNIPKEMIKWENVDLAAYFVVWLAGEESRFLHGRHVWANWDVDELLALKQKLKEDPSFLTIGQVIR